MASNWFNGPPGVTAAVLAHFKAVFLMRSEQFLPQGRYIDPTKSRDPSNTVDIGVLQAGLIMGKITASGLYAPSFYGVTGGAYNGTGTSITLPSAAVGTEILRRGGATGNVKITGPATAAGTPRTATAAYSAIVGTTMTVAAVTANEVQRINFNIAATGGNVVLRVPKANGEFALTTPAAWSATDATFLGNINTVLDAATGVTGGIVATAIAATDTDLGFVLTFSGVGYVGVAQPTELVSVETLPTSSTSYTVTRVTAGSSGAFVTGSFLSPADGSEVPLTFLPDYSPGIRVTDDAGVSVGGSVEFPQFPVAGQVDVTQLIPWPADTASRTWLMQQLSTTMGGKFIFGGTGGIF